MSDFEKRIVQQVEVRADDSGAKTLTGYAAVFNSPTSIGDYFIEQIAPGAFADAIRGDVRCLYNHDRGHVLGRTKAGTLRLVEDSKGLRFEVDLPNTTIGKDVGTLVERGDVSGCSFNFRATKQTWDDTVDPPLRTLERLEIDEISIVTFPAYDDTSVGVRSLEAARAETGRRANSLSAARRIAERRASTEQKIRGIRQDAS